MKFINTELLVATLIFIVILITYEVYGPLTLERKRKFLAKISSRPLYKPEKRVMEWLGLTKPIVVITE